jgi:hypothetical protein
VTTFQEFEQLPDPPEGHLELHHGQVVLIPPRKKIQVKVEQALLSVLKPLEASGRDGTLTATITSWAPRIW